LRHGQLSRRAGDILEMGNSEENLNLTQGKMHRGKTDKGYMNKLIYRYASLRVLFVQ
jgi:hypothetical protein